MTGVHHPTCFPHGVADEGGRVGFVLGRAGTITAIDLETGRVLWTTKDLARPLLVCGERLLAYQSLAPNTLQVVALDVSDDGALTKVSDPVTFPDWVNIDPEDTREFSLAATADDHFLVLAWEAHAYYRGGAPPSRQVIEHARKDAAGIARVELDTGKVAMLPSEPRPKAPPPFLPTPAPPLPEAAIGEHCQIGPYVYGLTEEQSDQSRRRSMLKKWQVGSGKLVWELDLGEWRTTRAPPRRM
jgi:hypothetical protein